MDVSGAQHVGGEVEGGHLVPELGREKPDRTRACPRIQDRGRWLGQVATKGSPPARPLHGIVQGVRGRVVVGGRVQIPPRTETLVQIGHGSRLTTDEAVPPVLVNSEAHTSRSMGYTR